MIHAITFDKKQSQELLSAFRASEPVTPNGESWTDDRLLQIAAAAVVALHSRMWGTTKGTDEYREAKLLTNFDDILIGVEFFAGLIVMAESESYDADFEPLMTASILPDGDGRAVVVTSGAKGTMQVFQPSKWRPNDEQTNQ